MFHVLGLVKAAAPRPDCLPKKQKISHRRLQKKTLYSWHPGEMKKSQVKSSDIKKIKFEKIFNIKNIKMTYETIVKI